jgi:hypothetical protein
VWNVQHAVKIACLAARLLRIIAGFADAAELCEVKARSAGKSRLKTAELVVKSASQSMVSQLEWRSSLFCQSEVSRK